MRQMKFQPRAVHLNMEQSGFRSSFTGQLIVVLRIHQMYCLMWMQLVLTMYAKPILFLTVKAVKSGVSKFMTPPVHCLLI